MDISNFKFQSDLTPDLVISKLIDVLDLKNLQFMTSKKLDELGIPPYTVDSVTMTGKPDYIKYRLKEIRKEFLKYLDNYTNSEESFETKIHVLGLSEIMLTEKLFYWDIAFPELYEGPSTFDLLDLDNKAKVVVLPELKLSDEIKAEIIQHHNVRSAFFKLLIKYINLLIKKVSYSKYAHPIDHNNTKLKSLDLLEVWLGLKQMGLVEESDKNEVTLRTEFFRLFGLHDLQYNDKHAQIKARQKPKFTFIDKMNSALKSVYEK